MPGFVAFTVLHLSDATNRRLRTIGINLLMVLPALPATPPPSPIGKEQIFIWSKRRVQGLPELPIQAGDEPGAVRAFIIQLMIGRRLKCYGLTAFERRGPMARLYMCTNRGTLERAISGGFHAARPKIGTVIGSTAVDCPSFGT